MTDAQDEYPEMDEAPWFRNPSHMMNLIERALRKLHDDPDVDDYVVGTVEVILLLDLPELRMALQDAGVELVGCGPSKSSVCACQDSPPTTAAAPAVVVETALYRWWDDANRLLYIGISDDLAVRTKGHAKRSSWMEFAARSTVERHPSKSAARRAEEDAIKAEGPIFNFQHNSTPEAKRRAIEYLIAHNRYDLLGLAVSRG